MAEGQPVTPPPNVPRVETQPRPDDYRALIIRNDFPRPVAAAIESQVGKRSSIGFPAGLIGELIGFVERDVQADHPFRTVETTIHGMDVPTKTEPIEGKPESRILETRPEFNVRTNFTLGDNIYIDTVRTESLTNFLQAAGYQIAVDQRPSGIRMMKILTNNGHSYDFSLGWATAEGAATYYRRVNSSDSRARRNIDLIEKGAWADQLKLEITPSSKVSPSGAVLDSTQTVLSYLDESKELGEIVATGLVQVISGKQPPSLRMDWLPPQAVKTMVMRRSSAVEGRVDATALVEQQIKEERGMEKLAGLPRSTHVELMRIASDLKDPKRAKFMKKHGFKQSSGAVFWGEPGTGKSLAAEAIAEEAGCERVVLKLDEYLTGYIHESAKKVGDQLRKIKERASVSDKQTVIHIDEADTILKPISGDSASARDAMEIRGMLLRELQEPSNVFYILTTNLDPRDPSQADPAIVRNQRLGNLVAFGLPDLEGRETIFKKETAKREADDLSWDNVDFDSLKQTTDGFSQADIQEVLSVSASLAYDSETDGAVVNQGHLEHAVNIIKSRKLQEAAVRERRKIGF